MSYRITTDRRGFRGLRPHSLQKPEGTRRILILGDSFTFGVGVEDEETFPAAAEAALNRGTATPDRYETLNAGCPGWGTENALAFWLERGRSLDVDLLVLAFFRNDFSDNMRRSLFEIRDGKAVFVPQTRPSLAKRISRRIPFYAFLCSHSHLLNLARRAAAHRNITPMEKLRKTPSETKGPSPSRDEAASLASAAQELQERRKQAAPLLLEQTELFEALMDALVKSAGAQGVPLLVLLLPGSTDIDPHPSSQLMAARRAAEKWEREGRIDLLDPYGALRASAAEGAELFLPVDHHYSAEGNRIVGELLAGKIQTLLENQ